MARSVRRIVTGHDAAGKAVVLRDEAAPNVLARRAGDVVVQRGTNHAWVNRGAGTRRIAFVLIDAVPVG